MFECESNLSYRSVSLKGKDFDSRARVLRLCMFGNVDKIGVYIMVPRNKVRETHLAACLPVCLSVCLFVCLSVCLSIIVVSVRYIQK